MSAPSEDPPQPLPDTVDDGVAEFPARYARTARFSLGTPRNLTVAGAGRQVLFCRSKQGDDPVLCLWALDVATGSERLVVDPAALAVADDELPAAERPRRERARESASGIVAYSTDQSGSVACFALAGGLFVVDVATATVTAPEHGGSVYDPHVNPQGTAIAYVDGATLRVLELGPAGGHGDRVLRADDDPLVSFGRADFIAAEEMSRSRGFWWSPDGTQLLVTRVDESPVTEWWIADPAHPDRSPTSVRFPPAGDANATVGLELVGLDGQTATIDWSDGGRYEYLADVAWDPDHPPLVVRQTRDQAAVSIAELTLADLTVTDLTVTERQRITNDVWVDLMPGTPAWCSEGLLTIEDLTDARHLCLDGLPLTEPGIHVRSIVGLLTAAADDDGEDGRDRAVIVSAWTEPTEIHLLAVPLIPDPAGEPPVRLTTEPGVHTAVLRSGLLVVTSSRPDQPGSRITARRFDAEALVESGGPSRSDKPSEPSAAAVATIASRAAGAGLAAEPTFLSLGPDGLQAALFLPSNIEELDGPVPVLLDPYGGPHVQRVLKVHDGHLVSRWFAENGYAVLVTDGRGTPGRGPAWERAVHGDLAGPVLDDQLAALDAALERYDVLDGDRVAIRGWSFGGFLAALAVLRRPDRVHAAISGAPVTSWRLYDTHYTERYLGHPDDDPAAYRRSDLVDDQQPVTGPLLTRPMLLIHGLADDNVVVAHSLRLSTALLASGSPHRVLPLSGVTHMTSQEAVAENLLRLQLSFLDETVGSPSP